MMQGNMRETHADGIPVQFIILFDFDISARMLQFYIERVNSSSHSTYSTNVHKKMEHRCAHILRALNLGSGLNLNGMNFNVNTIPHSERTIVTR